MSQTDQALADIKSQLAAIAGRISAIEGDIAGKLVAPPVVQTLPAPVVNTQVVQPTDVSSLATAAAVEQVRKLASSVELQVLKLKNGEAVK